MASKTDLLKFIKSQKDVVKNYFYKTGEKDVLWMNISYELIVRFVKGEK